MQPAYRFLPVALLALVSASSFAATTVYTSSASFLSNVAPGAYTQTFTGLSSPPSDNSATFSGLGFTYTASAPQGLYMDSGYLGTNQINEALTLSFTSGNVRAVGGNFFITNISDAFQTVSVRITLSDSTVYTFTPTSLANSYVGFVSTTPITSLVISAPGQSLYASVDNLTVGAVPEPSIWLLMALGGTGLLIAARKRHSA